MKSILNVLTVTLLLAVGCASVGRKIDQNAVAKIKQGATTSAEVRALIGAPDQITRDGDGNEFWSYIYARATAKGENFIPIYGSFAGGVNTQNQSTMITFTNGVVQKVVTSFGGTEVGTGLSSGSKATTTETDSGKRPK